MLLFFSESQFIFDEGTYAMMVFELSENPLQIIPTMAGESAEYKPPLFFWVYSAFFMFLTNLNLPIEMIFRLPSILFGSLSVLFVYLISNKLTNNIQIALGSAILFLTTPIMIFASTSIMMEAFSIFLLLSAVYFYMEKKLVYGMLFLGSLVLTKWLYVIAPVLFLVLYFKKYEIKVYASFLCIPFALLLYFLTSYFFGDINNLFLTFSFDISRTAPTFNLLHFVLFEAFVLWVMFPLLPMFLYFFLTSKNMLAEKHLIVLGLMAFLLPLTSLFIWWYAIIALPFIVIFVAKHLPQDQLFFVILSILILFGTIVFFSPPIQSSVEDISEITQFMKGKNVTFYTTKTPSKNWAMINQNYKDTNKSFILLEQIYPGIVYYRFNETKDYGNFSAKYLNFSHTVPCSYYLITDGPAEIPSCFNFVKNISKFNVYSSIE
ncbi:glycosyltransferase family 39 protein [Candidatus Micrarchaeota archaeon]|nr:glycosyltransferase family 39 protein [Candidatus Micrarchaeota archaeon]